MLDRIKPGKSLIRELEKKFPDIRTPLWGTASVNADQDPKLVVLTLNRSAGGIARKMTKTLKGTGFSKVEIRLKDGSPSRHPTKTTTRLRSPHLPPLRSARPIHLRPRPRRQPTAAPGPTRAR